MSASGLALPIVFAPRLHFDFCQPSYASGKVTARPDAAVSVKLRCRPGLGLH